MIERVFGNECSAMRKCARCGAVRPTDDFVWRKARGTWGSHCRECRAEYGRMHYKKNRAIYIDRARRRRLSIMEERTAFLVEYFRKHPCADCGEVDPVVLEFDHLDDKKFNVSEGLRNRNWESVLAEIAKCEVVCSNCHRRRTARRGGFSRVLAMQSGGGTTVDTGG
jgi:hypothetical protein